MVFERKKSGDMSRVKLIDKKKTEELMQMLSVTVSIEKNSKS